MEKTFDITEFKGLNDYGTPLLNASYTRSLNATVTQYNRLLGGLGINKLRSISSASATTPILGLMAFYDTALTNTLYRMTPTKVHRLNTGTEAWDDATGIDLTGDATVIPQHVVHKDFLVFANDGADQPRRVAASGDATVLGGTPPYAKAIWQGWGYLFLGNISTDGSTFSPRQVNYSDDYNVNWDLCTGNELNFNATNGEILAGAQVGEIVVVLKSDSLYQLSFEGGSVRFRQPRIQNFQHGLIAPASLALLDGLGLVFLGTDYRLHFTDGFSVKTLPPYVQRKLDASLVRARARFAVGVNYPDKDTYSLFYESVAADSWNRSRITFNFRTGEFNHRTYTAHEFVRALAFRYASTSANMLIASTSTLVYELDTLIEGDDGTAISRYYDIDWTNLNFTGEKFLKGIDIEAVRNATGRISVSVAADNSPLFVYEKFFDLRGLGTSQEYVKVAYRIGAGLKGHKFKIRIKMFHDSGVQVEIVPPARIIYEPVSEGLDEGKNTTAPQRMS